MIPRDLVIVRHGQSELNVAYHLSKNWDDSCYTKEFLERHGSKVRLTDTGIDQAKIAGKFLQDNGLSKFDKYFVSDYIRARETAVYLGMQDAKWQIEIMLRERELGQIEGLPRSKLCKSHDQELAGIKQQPFYSRPPQGESIADVCLRIQQFLDMLYNICFTEDRVIIVSHGDTMWAFRKLLEHFGQTEWKKLHDSKDPRVRINNGQILHYSRANPKNGTLKPELSWVKSICPTNPDWSRPKWKKIIRPLLSNEELLESVKKYPRLFNKSYD